MMFTGLTSRSLLGGFPANSQPPHQALRLQPQTQVLDLLSFHWTLRHLKIKVPAGGRKGAAVSRQLLSPGGERGASALDGETRDSVGSGGNLIKQFSDLLD